MATPSTYIEGIKKPLTCRGLVLKPFKKTSHPRSYAGDLNGLGDGAYVVL